MTEESYQQCRKVMQTINYRRGMITKSEGEVAKWTKIEASYRDSLQEGRANGAKKCLYKALIRLDEERAKFSALKFPDSDIVKSYTPNICRNCSTPIGPREDYCNDCS